MFMYKSNKTTSIDYSVVLHQSVSKFSPWEINCRDNIGVSCSGNRRGDVLVLFMHETGFALLIMIAVKPFNHFINSRAEVFVC